MKIYYAEIKASNFKCFGKEPQGFETIMPFNIIIGRNNSGKSALLDMLQYSLSKSPNIQSSMNAQSSSPEFICRTHITEEVVRRVFPDNVSRGGLPGDNHFEFGKQLIGTKIAWRLNEPTKCIRLEDCSDGTRPLDLTPVKEKFEGELAKAMSHPLSAYGYCRITAERDIVPETNSPGNHPLGDGKGVTQFIQETLNYAGHPSELVESELLEHLNRIFAPDAKFTRILCQLLDDTRWEIYLEEKNKGRIPLSQSGSGIKTVIIVLVHLVMVPARNQTALNNMIFAFEELENNLHPALLRRLLNYLYEHARTTGSIFFLTTHSTVAIDIFSRKSDAQIIHVTHDGKEARCTRVNSHLDNRNILSDLDVRASDLLQSNCIIWVEGPSDRIYLNHWIELYTNGELFEGSHYQCVLYGGRVLSHYSASSPDISEISSEDDSEVVDHYISLLNVNRNCCVVMDSDKRKADSRINDTKMRIEREVKSIDGFVWITDGKEIENYIPSSVVSTSLGVEAQQIDQYQDFVDYLNALNGGKGDKFKHQKANFAKRFTDHMTDPSVLNVLDLQSKIDQLCCKIRLWNGMPPLQDTIEPVRQTETMR